jgi:hypothetical protein
VSNSDRHLDRKLWHPHAFLKDFGHLKHDLINCLTGKVVPKASLVKFWKVRSGEKENRFWRVLIQVETTIFCFFSATLTPKLYYKL